MVDELDIYRSVNELMEQHGEDAPLHMPFPFLRPRTLRKIGPAANVKADCAGRQSMPPNQFRVGECRAPTRSQIVRACATVVLAVFMVSGLATGIRDAAAAIDRVKQQLDLAFGSAAGDADLAGTVVIRTAGAKSVTGGATDFGGADLAAQFNVRTTVAGETLTCTLPGSITLTGPGASMTLDTFTTNPLLSNMMPPGQDRVAMLIGATVHLAAGQAAGNYSGSFTFTCDALSDVANVTITLLAPISISAGASMDFGTMLTTGTAGTVTVTPAGARSSVNVDLLGGFPSGAGFNVTGASGQAYFITLPSSATLTSGGDTMTIDTFNHDAGASPSLVGGSDTFNVGATLNVGATQAAGTYSGTFAVTVNYN